MSASSRPIDAQFQTRFAARAGRSTPRTPPPRRATCPSLASNPRYASPVVRPGVYPSHMALHCPRPHDKSLFSNVSNRTGYRCLRHGRAGEPNAPGLRPRMHRGRPFPHGSLRRQAKLVLGNLPESLGEFASRPARGIFLLGRGIVDHFPGLKGSGSQQCKVFRERCGQGIIPRGDHAKVGRPSSLIDVSIIRRALHQCLARRSRPPRRADYCKSPKHFCPTFVGFTPNGVRHHRCSGLGGTLGVRDGRGKRLVRGGYGNARVEEHASRRPRGESGRERVRECRGNAFAGAGGTPEGGESVGVSHARRGLRACHPASNPPWPLKSAENLHQQSSCPTLVGFTPAARKEEPTPKVPPGFQNSDSKSFGCQGPVSSGTSSASGSRWNSE